MISDRLKSCILRELGGIDFPLTGETLAYEVPGWDSLNHVRVLAAVEKEFAVQFRSLEILRLKNVGDLQKLVDKKLASA